MNIETLKKFCAKERDDTKLLQPWSVGDWTYASNRVILLRVPRLADVPERDESSKVIATTFPFNDDGAWLDIPELPAPEMGDCRECKGIGKESKLCEACDGDGFVECVCDSCGDGHNRPCKKCIGSGFAGVSDNQCPKCDGTGKVEDKHTEVSIGNARFAARLLRLCVDNLTGVKILPNERQQAAITFDGGRGYIMPLR